MNNRELDWDSRTGPMGAPRGKINHEVIVIDNLSRRKIDIELGKKTMDSINGLQLIKIDIDCNNNYDISTIGKKKNKNNKYIVLIQDGSHYRPIFKIIDDKFKGIYSQDEINILLK